VSNTLTWADLFANGSLIDLDVSIWDGLIRMRPEDLGIDRSEAVTAALTFGHQRLVPKETLQAIRDHAYKARQAVDGYSIPFRLVPGSRYLPKLNREIVQAELENLNNKFMAAVNQFLAEYEANKATQIVVLREALREAAKDRSAVEPAMARIEREYPTEDQLRERFELSWKTYSIAAPQDGSANGNEGNVIKEELESMITRLREQLVERVRSIVELATRGGKITTKTYNSTEALCAKLESLNVFGDEGLASAIAAVRKAIAAASATDAPGTPLIQGLEQVEKELAKSREDAIAAAANRMAGTAERRFQL